MRLGPTEIFGIVVIIVLVFGPRRIGKAASDLGKSMRSLRDGSLKNAATEPNPDEAGKHIESE